LAIRAAVGQLVREKQILLSVDPLAQFALMLGLQQRASD
jgi:multidrug efflux pump subunit AcrA (membrane-fusion protein)